MTDPAEASARAAAERAGRSVQALPDAQALALAIAALERCAQKGCAAAVGALRQIRGAQS